jgi:signal transduction histidine kinase/CheY-like chemotaxis protein
MMPASEIPHDAARAATWLVLVVDDEPDIHDAIRLAVGRTRFFGRRIEFIDAMTAGEAEKIVATLDRRRFVTALVDVVMEHDTAGLELVGKLRQQFGSPLQIILNTGQPHIMTAEDVSKKFEISGYLSKPEATPERLKTMINISIRNFRKFNAMQVLCDSLTNFVSMFDSAASTQALDQLLQSALLQYAAVWQFSYSFFKDLRREDASALPTAEAADGLRLLRTMEVDRAPPGSFVKLATNGTDETWGCLINPMSGRFTAGLSLIQPERPPSVLLHELELLLRSWALTHESIQLRQLAEQEGRVREEMQRERRESIAQMVAGVAHEVNTPLGVANSAAVTLSEILDKSEFKALRQRPELEEDLDDIYQGLGLIRKNIARADNLIRSFRKLSVGQLVDKREELDLAQCVKEVIQLWTPEARRKQIAVQLIEKVDPRCARWMGYAGHLSQILLNLLSNAERYAYEPGKGGKVDVTLTSRLVDDKAMFEIEVRDYGAGIPKENLALIFEAFFTTGRSKGGTGLGLSIVQNIVTSVFGGTIRADSAPGEGTRFTVEFSHCKEPATPGAEGASEPASSVEALEDFLNLQKKLAHGEPLEPAEQLRLADAKTSVEALLTKRFGDHDRRGALRVPVRRSLAITCKDGGRTIASETREMSLFGAMHVGVERVDPSTRVQVVYSDDASTPRVAVEAEVVSCTEVERSPREPGWQIALKFVNLDEQTTQNLKLFIAHLIVEQVGLPTPATPPRDP